MKNSIRSISGSDLYKWLEYLRIWKNGEPIAVTVEELKTFDRRFDQVRNGEFPYTEEECLEEIERRGLKPPQ